MSELLQHKGYYGSIEHNLKDMCLYGKLLFIDDMVTYEAESLSDLQKEFIDAVEDYIQTCQELGQEPQKPYRGTFNVRVGAELHQAAVVQARKEDINLNEFVKRAIREKLDNSDSTIVKHVHEHVLKPSFIETGIYSGESSISFDQSDENQEEWKTTTTIAH